MAAGTYVVSEDAIAGYTVSYSGNSDSRGNITLASGDNKTVTITNDDIPSGVVTPAPATLHVIKHVINDNGRTAVAADFKLHVKIAGSDVAASPAPGVESPGTTYTLAAGTYVVSEDANAGYTVSYSGNSDSRGNITLASGDYQTVTITNDDIPIVSCQTYCYRWADSENVHIVHALVCVIPYRRCFNASRSLRLETQEP